MLALALASASVEPALAAVYTPESTMHHIGLSFRRTGKIASQLYVAIIGSQTQELFNPGTDARREQDPFNPAKVDDNLVAQICGKDKCKIEIECYELPERTQMKQVDITRVSSDTDYRATCWDRGGVNTQVQVQWSP